MRVRSESPENGEYRRECQGLDAPLSAGDRAIHLPGSLNVRKAIQRFTRQANNQGRAQGVAHGVTGLAIASRCGMSDPALGKALSLEGMAGR